MKRKLAAVFLGSALAFVSGCGLLRAPQKMVSAVVPTSKQPDPVELQGQLQRYADDFTIKIVEALDDYVQIVNTDEARAQALRLKLQAGSAVLSVVSGPNPNASLLDLVSIATINRMTVQDYWMKTTNGYAFQKWLDTSRNLETNAWVMAGRVLKPAQLDELRGAITKWHGRNPQLQTGFYARPQEFAPMLTASPEKGEDVNSVFGLVGLDPTSGLDPAIREVTRTRLFAERALYTMQRIPFMIRMQTELLAYGLTEQAQVKQALTNLTRVSESVDRVSHATESISQTASQLPERISTERKEILAALDQQQGNLRGLSQDLTHSLEAGEKMSTSLNTTLSTFDGLMKRFGVGESTNQPAPDTNSRPFNILEYGQVAGQFGAMAQDFDKLINSVDRNVPQINTLARQTTGEAQLVVDRAFRLGLVLIAVLLLGSVTAALTYKFLSKKLSHTSGAIQSATDSTLNDRAEKV